MATSEEKLIEWLEDNPDGYFELPMKEIAEASKTSIAAVSQILPRLIARKEGVMPSVVKQKRFSNTQGRIDRSKLWELVESGLDISDVAFLLDCNEGTVREILRKEKQPEPANEDER